MNSVYFPAPVVLILRRLANVLSTLSISNQYLLAKGARAEEFVEDEKQSAESAPSSWDTLRALREVEWPTWMNRNTWEWPRFMTLNGPQFSVETASLKAADLTLQCACLLFCSDI